MIGSPNVWGVGVLKLGSECYHLAWGQEAVMMSARRLSSVGPVFALLAAAVLLMPAVAAAQDVQQGQVTFTKDVAPILQRSCQNCHRPGSIAPMSLLTFEDARPWARAIKEKVRLREMPPWYVDKRIGYQEFLEDRSLTDEQIATIVQWADSGAPRGNPADMPPPVDFGDRLKWTLNDPPDMIVTMPRWYTVKANGPDEKVSFYAESMIEEDRYVRAVETKPDPGSFRVVHHSNTSLMHEEEGWNDFLNEYAVGKQADMFPRDSGRLLPKGSRIVFNVHYHSVGEEIKSQSQVAFWLYPKGVVPKYEVHTMKVGRNDDLDIPAGAITRHDGYFQLPKAAMLLGFQPHTHIRGHRQCLEGIDARLRGDDNRPEPAKTWMITCANINFGWMLTYNYDPDFAPLVPAGTVLHLMTWHNNTAGKRENPNPKNWVGEGGRTTDDMNYAWMNMIFLDDDDYQRRIAEQKQRREQAGKSPSPLSKADTGSQ